MASISSERKQDIGQDVYHQEMQQVGLNLDKMAHRSLNKAIQKRIMENSMLSTEEMKTILKHNHEVDYIKLRLQRKLQAKQNPNPK